MFFKNIHFHLFISFAWLPQVLVWRAGSSLVCVDSPLVVLAQYLRSVGLVLCGVSVAAGELELLWGPGWGARTRSCWGRSAPGLRAAGDEVLGTWNWVWRRPWGPPSLPVSYPLISFPPGIELMSLH